MASSKRKAGTFETEENKRFRSAMDQMAEEWLCPLTLELPVDPVTAEDGRTYERHAIEAHIRAREGNLKSPITNEAMGSRLMKNAQARGTIDKLVRSGAVGGDKAESWLKRIADEEEVIRTRAAAEDGDAYSLQKLGLWYSTGCHGLEPDDTKAASWFLRGADLMDPCCLFFAGQKFLAGLGVERNPVQGISFITLAAAGGYAHAAEWLAEGYHSGSHGLSKNIAHAKHWYQQIVEKALIHLNDEMIRKARAALKKMSR
jgi:TPR repeat protein